MIEAVNSVVLNAPLVRGSADQTSSARALTISSVQTEAASSSYPQAPYISPFISMDVNFDKAVLQIRDADTGDVLRQFPSEETLAARQRAEIARDQAQTVQAVRRGSQPAAQRSEAPSQAPQSRVSNLSPRAALAPSSNTELSAPDTDIPSAQVAQAQLAAAALSSGSRTAQLAQGGGSTFQTSA